MEISNDDVPLEKEGVFYDSSGAELGSVTWLASEPFDPRFEIIAILEELNLARRLEDYKTILANLNNLEDISFNFPKDVRDWLSNYIIVDG